MKAFRVASLVYFLCAHRHIQSVWHRVFRTFIYHRHLQDKQLWQKGFSCFAFTFFLLLYCFINSANGLAAVSSFSFEALPWLNNAGADWRVKIPMPAWPQRLIREKCWAHTLQPPGLPPRSLTEHCGSLRKISLTDRGEELNGLNWEQGQWGQRQKFQRIQRSVHSLFLCYSSL